MKIFATSQIKEIDRQTIENEPIPSIDLMERAANSLFQWFAENISSAQKIIVFAGPGNNGGDGLALTRMLIDSGYYIAVYLLESSSLSADCQGNFKRLKNQGIITPYIIKGEDDFPVIDCNSVIIDALFGSGLTRPLSGISAKLINFINSSKSRIISIDMPSGLFGEENPYPNQNPIIKASTSLTLQFPKLSFFFAENNQYVGEFIVIPIGLNSDAIHSAVTSYHYIISSSVTPFIKTRNRFSHKGDSGHCLIIAGSKGMMGAAVLTSTACIKSGTGLVTAHVPEIGYSILQQSIPEVMVDVDSNSCCFSSINSISKYSAIAIGPGLGVSQVSVEGMIKLIKEVKSPIVIDADGLNILSANSDLLDLIPPRTIITPHPGEFDRLFGKSDSGYQRLTKAIVKSAKYNIFIVLKGANSQVVCPDGKVYFNSTGNPGMATAGSGDVLTGIITSLLGQGYNPELSSIMGVYLHGLAGDLAVEKKGVNSVTASDIICYLGDAFNLIYNK